MKHLVAIILYLSILQVSDAQNCFFADKTRGCAPLTVKMTLTDTCLTASQPQFDFGNGGGFVTADTNTYPNPGLYTVALRANFIIGGATISRVNYISVLASPEPDFTIFKCEGRGVRIRINDGVYEQYIISYGDGSPNDTITWPQNFSPPHTYPNLQSRTVTVRGRYVPGDCGGQKSQQVTPITGVNVPAIQSLNQSGNSATLTFSTQPDIRYIIYRGIDTATQVIDTLMASGTTTVYTLASSMGSGSPCFRIASLDGCDQMKSSALLCGFSGITISAPNDYNLLNWINPKGVVQNLQLSRIDLGNLAFFGIAPIPQQYNDSAVICGQNYCYSLRATMAGSGATVGSDTFCITAVSIKNPSSVIQPYASVENGVMLLRWDLPTGIVGGQIRATRTENNGSAAALRFPFLNEVTDKPARLGRGLFCYSLSIRDTCGNQSQTQTKTCAIWLRGTGSGETERQLNWTAFSGLDTTIDYTYTLQKLDPQNNVVRSIELGNTLSYLDNVIEEGFQNIGFRIRATSPLFPDKEMYSNTIILEQRSGLYVPSAFSPNGDGVNDLFFVQGRFLDNFRLSVFNKWGELIYQSLNFTDQWDGTFRGKIVPTDVYVYVLEASDVNGKKFTRKGTITILN